jgi:hypothetical protein
MASHLTTIQGLFVSTLWISQYTSPLIWVSDSITYIRLPSDAIQFQQGQWLLAYVAPEIEWDIINHYTLCFKICAPIKAIVL